MSKEKPLLFVDELEKALEGLFKTSPHYSYVASKSTPRQLAERLTQAAIEGTMQSSGEGVRTVCAKLGIKPGLRSIQDYLRKERENAKQRN